MNGIQWDLDVRFSVRKCLSRLVTIMCNIGGTFQILDWGPTHLNRKDTAFDWMSATFGDMKWLQISLDDLTQYSSHAAKHQTPKI